MQLSVVSQHTVSPQSTLKRSTSTRCCQWTAHLTWPSSAPRAGQVNLRTIVRQQVVVDRPVACGGNPDCQQPSVPRAEVDILGISARNSDAGVDEQPSTTFTM